MPSKPILRIAGVFMLFPFLIAQSQPKKTIYDQLRKPAGSVMFHGVVALCEDYPEESTTPSKIRNDFEVLKRSGVNVLRIAFGWDGIEQSKGKFTWLFWDDLVRTAVDDYGITLIPYVCYTPRWNSTGDTTNYWNHPPKEYDEFGVFMGALVNRYKDRIKSWELWNEADISVFWSGNAEELARLVKIGSDAVRKADPEAIVVLGGLAWNTNFTLSLFRDFGISPYVDVVNMHSYFETWHGSPMETLPSYVNTVADIVRKYGNNQPLWMAETGYSDFRKGAYVSSSNTAYYDYEHTTAYQAQALFRTLTLVASTGKISTVAWYRINDLKPAEDVIGDVNNRYLGVDYLGYRPKPAEKAIAFFNRTFSGKTRCIDAETAVHRTLGSETEVHAFRDEEGATIIVGWLKTCVPGHRGDDNTGNVKDTRKETIELRLPYGTTGVPTRYDELGAGRPFPHVTHQANATGVGPIELTGGDIFILEIAQ